MVPVGRVLSKTASDLAISNLDRHSIAVFQFFLLKIGYDAIPRPVPLETIENNTGLSRKQVRLRINKLIKGKLLEKWTKKHPTQFKITYYRVIFNGNRRLLYRSRSHRLASERSYTPPPSSSKKMHF